MSLPLITDQYRAAKRPRWVKRPIAWWRVGHTFRRRVNVAGVVLGLMALLMMDGAEDLYKLALRRRRPE